MQPGPSDGQTATLERTTSPTGDDGGSAIPGNSGLLSGALMAAGVTVLLAVVVGKLRRRQSSSIDNGRDAHRDRIERIRAGASKRDELVNLMVDVEELTRRFAAQLDNKAARLEHLLSEADEKLARLERMSAGNGGVSTAGRDTPRQPREPASDADPITREIYRLADEGHEPVEIARQLEQHTGKVELILALRNA